jgi:hypothetical protein
MTDHSILATRVGGLKHDQDPILPFSVEKFLKIAQSCGEFCELLFSELLLSIEGKAFRRVDLGKKYLAVGWHTVLIHNLPVR